MENISTPQRKRRGSTQTGKQSKSARTYAQRNYGKRISHNPFHAPVSGIERKTVDTLAQNINPVPTTATISLINGSAQGSDYTQRIGRKTKNVSVYLRSTIFPISTTSSFGDVVRIMIVMDKQPNGVVFAITDLLTSSAIEAPNNLNNRDRFAVLHDQSVVMGAATYAANIFTGGTVLPVCHNVYKKVSFETIWQGTTAAIASIASNALYFVVLSDVAETQINWSTRVRFEDE